MTPAVQVVVEPGAVVLLVEPGETVIEAAWRAGYYWPTVCGGKAECRSCFLRVVAGAANTEPPDEEERSQIRRIPVQADGEEVRLACRLHVRGEVVVTKKGVRPKPT